MQTQHSNTKHSKFYYKYKLNFQTKIKSNVFPNANSTFKLKNKPSFILKEKYKSKTQIQINIE